MSVSLKFPTIPADGRQDMDHPAHRLRSTSAFAVAVGVLVATGAGSLVVHRDAMAVVSMGAAVGLAVLAWPRRSVRPTTRTPGDEGTRMADLRMLVEASTLLQQETSKDAIVGLIAGLSVRVFRAGGASVYLTNEAGYLIRTASHGDGCHLVDPRGGAVTSAISEGRVIAAVEFGVPVLLIPVAGTSGTHGLVAMSAPRDGMWFDPFVFHLGRLFGSHAGLALERLHVIANLTQATMRDPLTGVGNRRRAAELLGSLRPADAVLLIDLDHFKLVNDSDGHVAGDVVLVCLARYLRDSLRDHDAVARYGGEEFLVVLRDIDGDASSTANRLCAGWRATQPRTTFSVGGAVHSADVDTAATFARADKALYRAKRTGRDRVVMWDGAEEDAHVTANDRSYVEPDVLRSTVG